MSVMIKGMEMPSYCETCCFYNALAIQPICNLTDTKILGRGKARLNNCPLEEVKKPSKLEKEMAELEGILIDILKGKTELTKAMKVKPRRVRK